MRKLKDVAVRRGAGDCTTIDPSLPAGKSGKLERAKEKGSSPISKKYILEKQPFILSDWLSVSRTGL
ncbi:hypothetical protein [Algoriphagus sp. NG3]|uniref:hypothetical protein n=1 Tax=unclassified Algoriphagus TaxID=2641541 RepID=UPI002A81E271|nr:hypothetical protein [Algoriphagus sp. NG3]WPR76040.1 hypothetical protein SLW71_01590 [Algoriphagus sp. NG3]